MNNDVRVMIIPRASLTYVSRFSKSFILILLGIFLALSSLGAGSGKRTQKPLGAHQESGEDFDRK